MLSRVRAFAFQPAACRQTLLSMVPILLGAYVIPSVAQAGSVLSLSNTPEVSGKLTLTATGIHVDGATASDVNLADLLEADFSDDPFQIQYFRSAGDNSSPLPAGWTAKAIGGGAGSATYAKGTLILSGDGSGYQDKQPDHFYFAGQPWAGDGQWTAYLHSSDGELGFMLRQNLDPGATMVGPGFGSDGGGMMHYGGNYKGLGGSFPTYLRVTRLAGCLDTAESQDGKSWDVLSQDSFDQVKYWVGYMINSRQGPKLATGVVDQILFTPTPPQPETMPTGILLTSGTFIAGMNGAFFLTDHDGGFNRANHGVSMKTTQVSAVIYHLTNLSEIKAQTERGLLLRNGDFLASDITLLNGMAQMSSIALGAVQYYSDTLRAVVVNRYAPIPSAYEIRLRDESTIRAKDFALTNGQLVMHEVGGLTIYADPSEVVAIRAGTARVQPLINLAWKAPASPAATAAPAAASPAISPAAATAPAKPDVAPAATAEGMAAGVELPVTPWQGPNREQILAIAADAPVDFPLKGKFDALAMRLAVAPGAPAKATATLHVLSGGKEISVTPALVAGDGPRSLWLPLGAVHGLTIKVESAQPGTRLMLIDPVAVLGK